MKEGLGNLALQTVGKPDFFIPTTCKNARHGDPHLLFQDWRLVDRILRAGCLASMCFLANRKSPKQILLSKKSKWYQRNDTQD